MKIFNTNGFLLLILYLAVELDAAEEDIESEIEDMDYSTTTEIEEDIAPINTFNSASAGSKPINQSTNCNTCKNKHPHQHNNGGRYTGNRPGKYPNDRYNQRGGRDRTRNNNNRPDVLFVNGNGGGTRFQNNRSNKFGRNSEKKQIVVVRGGRPNQFSNSRNGGGRISEYGGNQRGGRINNRNNQNSGFIEIGGRKSYNTNSRNGSKRSSQVRGMGLIGIIRQSKSKQNDNRNSELIRNGGRNIYGSKARLAVAVIKK